MGAGDDDNGNDTCKEEGEKKMIAMTGIVAVKARIAFQHSDSVYST